MARHGVVKTSNPRSQKHRCLTPLPRSGNEGTERRVAGVRPDPVGPPPIPSPAAARPPQTGEEVERLNPYPTSTEAAFEHYCEQGLLEDCWDRFLSNEGDPFVVLGNLVIEVIRWARTERAHEEPRVDAASEAALLAMETLARSLNCAVRRGELEMLGEVESWTDLDLWWTGEPLLPRPVKNAVKLARPKVVALVGLVRRDLPGFLYYGGLAYRAEEAVRRAYQDVAAQCWWEDNPGPRRQYAHGYTE